MPSWLWSLPYIFFYAAFGLCISGITHNLYRMLLYRPQQRKPALEWVFMILMGPSVLIGNAIRDKRIKKVSNLVFGLAVAFTIYWSLVIGYFTFTGFLTMLHPNL